MNVPPQNPPQNPPPDPPPNVHRPWTSHWIWKVLAWCIPTGLALAAFIYTILGSKGSAGQDEANNRLLGGLKNLTEALNNRTNTLIQRALTSNVHEQLRSGLATIQARPNSWEVIKKTLQIIAIGSTSWHTWYITLGLNVYINLGASFFLSRLGTYANANQLEVFRELVGMIVLWFTLRRVLFPAEGELANLTAYFLSLPVLRKLTNREWIHATDANIKLMYRELPAYAAAPYIVCCYSEHLDKLIGLTVFSDPRVWGTTMCAFTLPAAWKLTRRVAREGPIL